MNNIFNESKGQELSQGIDFQWQDKFSVDAAISAVNTPILSGSTNLVTGSYMCGLNLEKAGRMINLNPNLNSAKDFLDGKISLIGGNNLSTLNLLNTDYSNSLTVPGTEHLWKGHLNVDPITGSIISTANQSGFNDSIAINNHLNLNGYHPAGPAILSASTFPKTELLWKGHLNVDPITGSIISTTNQSGFNDSIAINKHLNLSGYNPASSVVLSASTFPKTEILWKGHLNVDPITGSIISTANQSGFNDSIAINNHLNLSGYNPANSVVLSASYKPFSWSTGLDTFGLVSEKTEVMSGVWNSQTSTYFTNPRLFATPGYSEMLGGSIRVSKDGSLFLRSEAPIVYQPPTTSSKVEVNYALAARLGNMNTNIKESYISAVRILNSRDYEYTRYMCLSLRQVFDYFVKHLPNKAEMLAWVKDKPEYFVYNPDCGKLIEDRISSIGVYMFLTKHVSGYPDGKEFRKIFDSISPAIHAFKVVYNYDQGVEVLKKCEQMIKLILDANDALNS